MELNLNVLTSLSPKEKEVLELRARGLMLKEIAGHLSISKAMVGWHLHRLLGKLGVDSSLKAVLILHSRGIRRATGPGKRKAYTDPRGDTRQRPSPL